MIVLFEEVGLRQPYQRLRPLVEVLHAEQVHERAVVALAQVRKQAYEWQLVHELCHICYEILILI